MLRYEGQDEYASEDFDDDDLDEETRKLDGPRLDEPFMRNDTFEGIDTRSRRSSTNRSFGGHSVRSHHHHIRQGTIFSTVANMLCTMIGGGVLAVPLAFAQSSLLLGVIVVIINGLISTLSVYFLTQSCETLRVYSFRALIVRSFPNVSAKLLGNFVESLILVSNLAFLMIYTEVISDSMPSVFISFVGPNGVWAHKWFWMVVSGSFFALLSPIRRLSELLVVAVLGFLAVVFVCTVVFAHFGKLEQRGTLPHDGIDMIKLDAGILPAFSVVISAYTFQMNVPPLYGELKNPSVRRMMVAGCLSCGIASSLYIAVGICGYLAFGKHEITSKESAGNFLNSFPKKDVLANAARAVIVLHLLCAFPIYTVVARRSLNIIITGSDDEGVIWRRVVLGVAIVAVGVITTLFIPGIDLIMDFSGALFGVAVGVTLPALFFFRIHGNHNRGKNEPDAGTFACESVISYRRVSKTRNVLYCMSAVLVVFGILQSASSLIVTVLNLVGVRF